MVQVTVEGERREYGIGTLLKDVAEEFQPRYENDILLAFVNGKLQELHKLVRSGTEIRFLTAKDKPGMQTYQVRTKSKRSRWISRWAAACFWKRQGILH